MSDVLGIFEAAFEQSPSAFAASRRSFGEPEVWRLLSSRDEMPAKPDPRVAAQEVWPLISHHSYGSRGLFGQSQSGRLIPRTLNLLLRHDGIVAADPLSDVHARVREGHMDQAVRFAQQVTAELAQVESLIQSGALRFTDVRPSLTDGHRQALLAMFGLDPSLQVFRNFIDAAPSVASVPDTFATEYAPQVHELFELFGLSTPTCRDLEGSVKAVQDLAAAFIEVSWQFAVCAEAPAADLALRRGLELTLATRAFESARTSTGQVRSLRETRHFTRFELGDVPNLDADRLTIADAVAIRWDDSFASFRGILRAAIDDYERDLALGREGLEAQASFEERMLDGAETLRHRARRASFRDVVAAAFIPAGLVVATDVALASRPTILGSAAAGAVTVASAAIGHWLSGRQTAGGKVAQRYCALLAGSAP